LGGGHERAASTGRRRRHGPHGAPARDREHAEPRMGRLGKSALLSAEPAEGAPGKRGEAGGMARRAAEADVLHPMPYDRRDAGAVRGAPRPQGVGMVVRRRDYAPRGRVVTARMTSAPAAGPRAAPGETTAACRRG